jgi:hypothetical protein
LRDQEAKTLARIHCVISNIGPVVPEVKPKPVPQPVQVGQMYTTKQVTYRAGISSNTLKKWVARGLPVYHPGGTKHDFYVGDDVIEFVRSDGRQPAPKPSKKPTARKRKD